MFFLSALGLGVQYMYQQMLRNPYYRRFRNMLHNFWEGDAHAKERRPLRLPVSLLQLDELLSSNSSIPVEHYTAHGRIVPSKSNDQKDDNNPQENDTRATAASRLAPNLGSVCQLVSPGMNSSFDASTSLHISLIVLEAHAEMPSQESSDYYEFYHVLSGQGCYSQQGLIDTQSIQSGDVFVIDPLSIRWIANKAAPAKQGATDDNQHAPSTSSTPSASAQQQLSSSSSPPQSSSTPATVTTPTSYTSSFLNRTRKKPNPLVLLRVTDGRPPPTRFQRDPNALSSSSSRGGGGLWASFLTVSGSVADSTEQSNGQWYYDTRRVEFRSIVVMNFLGIKIPL